MFKDLVGKPFIDMGRGPEGYDCWGMVIEVNRRIGNNIPDYGEMVCPDAGQIINGEYTKHKHEWDCGVEPQAGDIVVIKKLDGNGLHFGVMINSDQFIHTSRESGARVESISSPARRKLIKEIGRCRIIH